MSGKHAAGKGDKYRPVDYKKWSENWDNIFGKKDINTPVKGAKNVKSNNSRCK